MTTFAAFAGYVGAGAFFFLTALLLTSHRGKAIGRLLIAASLISVLWFTAQVVYYQFQSLELVSANWLRVLECGRNAAWLALLLGLLRLGVESWIRRPISIAEILLFVLIGVEFGIAVLAMVDFTSIFAQLFAQLYFGAGLAISLGGLILIEQLFRNSSRDSRWAIKHLCFGLGMLFAYDFYMYADALLFNRLDAGIWSARGLVNAFAAPMIAVSAARNREWELSIFVSRRVAFHSITLIAGGLYLLIMAAAGYYIQAVGGEWGQALKVAFFSAALLILLSLLFSTQLRSRVRAFLAKHFYRNKYEYGEEWLKFTQRLERAELDPDSLGQTILAAIADIVDSPGGVIWQKTTAGDFEVAGKVSLYDDCELQFSAGDGFVTALERDQQPLILDVDSDDDELPPLPGALLSLERAALLVPIVHRAKLLAFMVLARPRAEQSLSWEDMDLLSTVGRQAASYLALVRATEDLSEARQFETYNRLTAFLVHDLKNVVAQLSLIGSNARKHRHNPEFIDDALNTVTDAVDKMNRMLTSLRQVHNDGAAEEVIDLCEIARTAANNMTGASPALTIELPQGGLFIKADRVRLLSVLEHLLQNAVEATDETGSVSLAIARHDATAVVKVADTGKGMDREFLRKRLFKPFDTTKGKAGMGIGAYESRHVISSMGGRLLVESAPRAGTTFTIVLPALGAPN